MAKNALLPRDKFQLCPQRLKLKGILGSGAYGIVRLASLQDEFGTVMDVAVKMMKGTMQGLRPHGNLIVCQCNAQCNVPTYEA